MKQSNAFEILVMLFGEGYVLKVWSQTSKKLITKTSEICVGYFSKNIILLHDLESIELIGRYNWRLILDPILRLLVPKLPQKCRFWDFTLHCHVPKLFFDRIKKCEVRHLLEIHHCHQCFQLDLLAWNCYYSTIIWVVNFPLIIWNTKSSLRF